VRLPIRLERLVNLLVVTPRMHGIHHSAVRAETDSNYSVIFRLWDRVHRTLRLGVPQAEIDIGVPAYQEPGDNRLAALLTMPFSSQRPYWKRPDGREPARKAPPADRAEFLME
jgi:sterol desaturase/sphingolipid hydroxylase (fatty acid hydroxylase superfamily)